MKIIDILNTFSQSHFGTESFKSVRQQCEEALHNESKHSAVYFFVAEYCRAHVNFYEDQEISPEFAKTKHHELSAYLQDLKLAMQHEDLAPAHQALNKIIKKHFKNTGVT